MCEMGGWRQRLAGGNGARGLARPQAVTHREVRVWEMARSPALNRSYYRVKSKPTQ
jgi:hypothetical protein